jgi:hypothetical protein
MASARSARFFSAARANGVDEQSFFVLFVFSLLFPLRSLTVFTFHRFARRYPLPFAFAGSGACLSLLFVSLFTVSLAAIRCLLLSHPPPYSQSLFLFHFNFVLLST